MFRYGRAKPRDFFGREPVLERSRDQLDFVGAGFPRPVIGFMGEETSPLRQIDIIFLGACNDHFS